MSAPLSNRLLVSLSAKASDDILAHCTAIPLPKGSTLYEPNTRMSHAFFVTSGIVSITTDTIDGDAAEVGMIGNEGLVGAIHMLGPARVASTAMAQLDGSALRIPIDHLRGIFRSSEEVRDRILEFVQEESVSLGQIAGCHRLHEAEERLSRWLLMAQDRAQTDVLQFTHEFLAQMLGARRTTVTLVAGALQRANLIEYQRGKVKIIDRAGLEDVACDCYQVTRDLHRQLYRSPLG